MGTSVNVGPSCATAVRVERTGSYGSLPEGPEGDEAVTPVEDTNRMFALEDAAVAERNKEPLRVTA